MRKLFLLMTAGLFAVNAGAQHKTLSSHVELGAMNTPVVKTNSTDFTMGVSPYVSNVPATSSKNTVGGSRWYNHAETMGEYREYVTGIPVDIYDTSLSTFYPMWQDSTVLYDNSTRGIQFLTFGQVFHPQSPLFNDENNAPSNHAEIMVDNSQSYTIDSVKVTGWYNRSNNGYVDTLIFSFVYENNVQDFSYWSMQTNNHNVDSFVGLLWSLDDYGVEPITQVPYGIGGSFLSGLRIKVPLNDATYADSVLVNNSIYLHQIAVAPGLALAPGKKAAVTVTFKSGTSYIAGDPISNYNYFLTALHETIENQHENHVTGDLNMLQVVPKDTSGWTLNATLGLYVPGVAWTPGFRELINFSWKVNCASCNYVGTSVNETGIIRIADAYPNPVSSELSVPVTLSESAPVTITLVNTLGQTVREVNLGKIAANQPVVGKISTANLAEGVYFYTVNAGGNRITKRVIVSH